MAGSQSGFPKKPFSPLMSNRCSVSSIKMLKTVHQRCVMRMRVRTMDVRVSMGDTIDPFQLANGSEAVIGLGFRQPQHPTRRWPRTRCCFLSRPLDDHGCPAADPVCRTGHQLPSVPCHWRASWHHFESPVQTLTRQPLPRLHPCHERQTLMTLPRL